MNIQKIIHVFNRDIRMIYQSHDINYRINIIKYSIDFYSKERDLSDDDPAKVFTDDEYNLIVKLYENELNILLV